MPKPISNGYSPRPVTADDGATPAAFVRTYPFLTDSFGNEPCGKKLLCAAVTGQAISRLVNANGVFTQSPETVSRLRLHFARVNDSKALAALDLTTDAANKAHRPHVLTPEANRFLSCLPIEVRKIIQCFVEGSGELDPTREKESNNAHNKI